MPSRLILTFTLLFIVSCSKPPLVKSSKVIKAKIEATVSSVNSGVVRSEKIAELAFGAVGRVKSVNVKLGDIVDKDTIIAEIENEDMKSTLATASRELERQRSLNSKGLSSTTLIDQAQSALQIAQIAYNKTMIYAPFRGLIAELNLEVGQLSQITTELRMALVRIIDLEPRYVRAEIDEVDLPRIKVGQSAKIKVLALRKEAFDAEVRKVVPFVSSVREQDRTSEIELSLKSEQLLPAGASADVDVIVERKENVLAIPIRSINSKGAQRYVYKLEDGKAKKIEIKIGIDNFDLAEVISGLNEGDTVLIPSESAELIDGLAITVE